MANAYLHFAREKVIIIHMAYHHLLNPITWTAFVLFALLGISTPAPAQISAGSSRPTSNAVDSQAASKQVDENLPEQDLQDPAKDSAAKNNATEDNASRDNPTGDDMGTEAEAEAGSAVPSEAATNTPATPPTENAVPDKIRFAALVQFATKGADRLDARRVRQHLNFQDAMYEGDRLKLDTDAFVKLVLRNKCIFVFYGEGQAIAPNREKPWRIKTAATRWICPEGETVRANVNGLTFNLAGEGLIDGERLLALRGAPKTQTAGTLKPKTVYSLTGRQVVALTPQPSAVDIYTLNEKRPLPKESLILEKPKKAKDAKGLRKPASFRLLIGPTFGGGDLLHDHPTYSNEEMSSDGGRLQLHFKTGDRTLLVVFNFVQELSDDQSKRNTFNYPPPGKSSSRLQMPSLEFGLRFKHDRWWSPYVRGGIVYMQNKMSIRDTSNNFQDFLYEYYGLNATAGIDILYAPSWFRWLGISAFAELSVARSLLKGGAIRKDNCANFGCSPPRLTADPHDPITVITPILGLSLVTQF